MTALALENKPVCYLQLTPLIDIFNKNECILRLRKCIFFNMWNAAIIDNTDQQIIPNVFHWYFYVQYSKMDSELLTIFFFMTVIWDLVYLIYFLYWNTINILSIFYKKFLHLSDIFIYKSSLRLTIFLLLYNFFSIKQDMTKTVMTFFFIFKGDIPQAKYNRISPASAF